MNCPSCGALPGLDATHCDTCGASLPEPADEPIDSTVWLVLAGAILLVVGVVYWSQTSTYKSSESSGYSSGGGVWVSPGSSTRSDTYHSGSTRSNSVRSGSRRSSSVGGTRRGGSSGGFGSGK